MYPRYIKARCYIIYIRPTLKYFSTVWDPNTQKCTAELKAVQQRRCEFNYYDKHTSVMPMLSFLTGLFGEMFILIPGKISMLPATNMQGT